LLLRPEQEESMPLERTSLGHFDENAFRVINKAADEAKGYQHNWIGTEHLLLAFAQLDREVHKMLLLEGVDIAKVRKSFEAVDFGATTNQPGIFITHRVERVFGIAEGIAMRDDRRRRPRTCCLRSSRMAEELRCTLSARAAAIPRTSRQLCASSSPSAR
jgi:ATP-dependent Clp protease ATP-binding subunit ClpA